MAFVKVIKNKAYSMRMQVKPKRRRQAKTDYYARRRLVCQEKNKYESRKYRLVSRRTNRKFIAQIVYSTMSGDRIMCAADSTELRRHGITAGLTNYAAGYATGLLLARRLLKQLNLAGEFKANEDINGEQFNIEDTAERTPFKALLDVGINATTTGARVFSVMKGACDGGINVPHSVKRFPGYSKAEAQVVTNKRGKTTDVEKTEAHFEASVLRDRIFGNHVTEYMNQLKKEDAAAFSRQFSQWEKCLAAAKAKTCEDLYKKAHAAILANADRAKNAGNAKPVRKVLQAKPIMICQNSKGGKWLRAFRDNLENRKARVQQRFVDAAGAQ